MAADGGDLASLQEQLKLAIAEEAYEKCAPLRDKIKQAQAALAAQRTVEVASGVQSKTEVLNELEAQLVLAVKLCDFALCISLRDQIKFLKCAACGTVFPDDALICSQCSSERPTPPDISSLTWRATLAGPSTPVANTPSKDPAHAPPVQDETERLHKMRAPSPGPRAGRPVNPGETHRRGVSIASELDELHRRMLSERFGPEKTDASSRTSPPALEKKDPEMKPDNIYKMFPDNIHRAPDAHKIQPLPAKDKPFLGSRTMPSVPPPASRVVLEAPTRTRTAQPPPLISQNSAPNLHARALPQLAHSNQECEDQLWSLLGTLDADGNYSVARNYFMDRGRGAFFILFKDKQALFEATKATFQYQTQQGLTAHGVYGTELAAALNSYDPQNQFIGCVLLKELSHGQPLFLCQLFGEGNATGATSGLQGREALEAKLEKKLQQRPTLEQIQRSSIRPSAEEAKSTEEAKRTIWNTLTGFFRWRPKVVELERLNILTTPVCFGITLAQVYARSNLGDGVLVPNIVRKLIGQLRKEDISQLVGIFRINGDPSLTVSLKRQFDFPQVSTTAGPNECVFCQTVFPGPIELKVHSKEHEGELAIPGPNISKADPHTLAGLLKMFLRELSEPLFPFEMYLPIYEAASAGTFEKVLPILAKLPPINAATWNMILDFLVEVCFHQKTNMMPPRNVGIVMAPNILRLPPKLDTIVRFAHDTPFNVATIEFLVEQRAKELNMVPKGVPPPKPVISASAAKNLLDLSLPPLLPPVEVPTAELQAPSAAPALPPLPAPPLPSSSPGSRSFPAGSEVPPAISPRPDPPVTTPTFSGTTSFPPVGRPGATVPVRPPIPPPKVLVSVQSERKLASKDWSDSEETDATRRDSLRRAPPPLGKSMSSSNLSTAKAGHKTVPPLGPPRSVQLNVSRVADSVSPSSSGLRNVRPPMPPPR